MHDKSIRWNWICAPCCKEHWFRGGGVWMLFLFFWWSVTVKDEYTRRGYSSLPKWHCLILGKDRCVLNEEKLIITNASNFMVSSIVIYWELYANWDSKAWRYHWFFLALSFGISFHRFQLLFALLFLQKKKFKWFTSNQKPSCRSVSTCICIYMYHIELRVGLRPPRV